MRRIAENLGMKPREAKGTGQFAGPTNKGVFLMAKRKSKKPARRTTKKSAKRPAARKAAAPPPKMKAGAAAKPRTKAEIMGLLADHAGVSKKEVLAVFDGITQLIEKDLSKRGPGALNLGGLMKVTVQRKPATKARKGINPFTGEEAMFKAKPARNVVKVRPMKAMKDLV